MDVELRSLEKKSINDPSQIPKLLKAQRRAGKMIFKNSKGLEILNQCAGIYSQKFEIKTSTRIQYSLIFPALNDDDDDGRQDEHQTWVFLDVIFADDVKKTLMFLEDLKEMEDEKDIIILSLQIGNDAIIVEKVYISDLNIEKISERVNNLVNGLEK